MNKESLLIIKKIFHREPEVRGKKIYVNVPVLHTGQLKKLHNSGLECKKIVHNHKNCGQHLILIQIGVNKNE